MMIALVLGLVLTSVVVQIYMSNRKTYQIQDGLARLQESARFIKFTLGTDLRMAGYQGCLNNKSVTVNNLIAAPTEDTTLANDQVLHGYEGGTSSTWTPTLPSGVDGLVLGGTDVLSYAPPARPSATSRPQCRALPIKSRYPTNSVRLLAIILLSPIAIG